MGATQASAGVLAPYIEAREGHPLLDLTVRSLDLYDAFITQLGSTATLRYRRSGTLEVALDADGLHRLEAAAASLPRKGVHARLLDAAGARSEEPHLSEAVVGGLLIPSHGYVSAADLTRALTAAARRHGAQLIEHGRVRRIVSIGGDVRVETDRGSLSGNGVVLAAGSWSGQIVVEGVEARLPVRPVRGQLLQLAWSGPTLGRVIWSE